jgi:hypothetical protein
MSITKNFKAISICGFTGCEIIVTGEANVGMLDVMPVLEKRVPQGLNPTILLLNLINAGDAIPENFKNVQYNEKIEHQDQYKSVELFHDNTSIEMIDVVLK